MEKKKFEKMVENFIKEFGPSTFEEIFNGTCVPSRILRDILCQKDKFTQDSQHRYDLNIGDLFN